MAVLVQFLDNAGEEVTAESHPPCVSFRTRRRYLEEYVSPRSEWRPPTCRLPLILSQHATVCLPFSLLRQERRCWTINQIQKDQFGFWESERPL